MIQRLIELSIRNRIIVVILFILVGIGGIWGVRTAKIDAIPDVGENQQIVFTKWPGRSPKDIEEQITYPLSILLQGIPGVKTIRGISAFGFSTIYVIFEEDRDFYWSRTRILEKLTTATRTLPDRVSPTIGPDATGLGQIYWYTLENESDAKRPRSLVELRSIQDFYVKFLLSSVPGVSEVASIGGFIKEYQIDVDPQKLFAFDIHFDKLIQEIQNSNIDVGAEVIEDGDREFIIRGKGFLKSLSDIENIVIAIKNKTPIRIKDIARVHFGPGFRRGVLDKNGEETVGGVVTMRFNENPQEVIQHIKKRLETIQSGLPDGVALIPFYDRTTLIQKTIGTVSSALTQEIIITIIVILLFLLHFRSSLLVSLTLPFGIGISFILMKFIGVDSNIMSLSGMVIAIGSMVDMGIIMTENIYAHLEKSPSSNTRQKVEIIIQAAQEVGPSILIAVLTTIITFLPVFALTSTEGKLFIPLAWAKTLTMLGSVIVSIILIPAVAVFFLRGRLKPVDKNKIGKFIINTYRPALKWVLDHRKIFFLAPITLVIMAALAASQLGKEFMPSLDEGDILYMPTTTPDVSMTRARKLLAYTDKKLSEHPLVTYAVGKLGRADTALDPAPIAMFETIVKLIPESQWPPNTSIYDIMEELDAELQIPGLVNSWNFPIQTRIGMVSTGIKTQIGIKIFGNDLKTLEDIASQVGREITKIPGAFGVYTDRITGKPYIELDIDRVAASRYGINTGTINKILQTAVGGMAIGQFYDGRERYPIRIRYKKEFRDRIENLKNILVPSPLGHHIPLSQIADIKIVTGPTAIQSENGMLRSVVLLNVKGRDLVGFVEEAREHIKNSIKLPNGYSIVWAGEYENQIRASKKLMFLVPLSLIINLLIIFIGIKNFKNSIIIFSSVPIAFCGGLILLWIFGMNTSVAVWVGFIALFGIAVDDGVVMMTFLQKALKKNPPQDLKSLKLCILEAGSRRIRPLVMTTITTIIALLPIILSSSTGSEIMKPMAIPTFGGMLIELITLFVLPVTFCYFEEKKLKNVK